MGSVGDGAFVSSPDMEKFLCELLLDSTQPISERFRALFSLRNLKGPSPRDALILATRDSSNLLAHEAAFALGQMQDMEAIPALTSVLNDLSLHPIVRHEAAEALGAIGSDSDIPLLKNSLDLDPAQEVRETCELALQRIEHLKDAGSRHELSVTDASPFKSVDPAAPAASCSSVDQLRKVLLDEEKGMYERYAALFALRNGGGSEAVAAIIDSLGSKSALLRHEVAYVLGQLQDKAASAALSNILKDRNEHPMVRHEAAEALGSIADDQSVELLEEFVADPEPLVSQSCQVALSMLEFERSGKSFEDSWSLELVEVFALEREGEFDKHAPYIETPLGCEEILRPEEFLRSRVTNFMGILSRGLRIAPLEGQAQDLAIRSAKEFADLVSQSAQYCCTDKKVGLMLLSEVALGNDCELKNP